MLKNPFKKKEGTGLVPGAVKDIPAKPVTQSPTAGETKITRVPLDFPEAMKEVIAGNRIARLEWPNKDEYGLLKDGWLQIFRNNKFHTWSINDGDILGKDWVVL